MEEENKKRNKHAAEKTKSGHGIISKIIIFLILLIVIMAVALVLWYNNALKGTEGSSEEVTFEIKLGTTTDEIASILKEKGLIKDGFAFKLYVKLNNVSNFKAGKYTIKKDMGVPEIAEALQKGILFKDGYNITFVEGKTMEYIAKTIAENTNHTESEVYSLLKDEDYIDGLIEKYWFITDEIKNKNIYFPLEGYLFPDTYTFESKDVLVSEIFERMLDKMEDVLDEYKENIEKSKYSAHEILTIASITETEAIFDKDRKNVSSVLYNRLKENMSLRKRCYSILCI